MEVLNVRDRSSGTLLTVDEPTGETFVTVEVPPRGLAGGVELEYSMPVTHAPGPFGYNLLSTHLGRPWYPEALASGGRFVDFRDYRVSLRYPEAYGLLSTAGPGKGEVRDGFVHASFAVEGEEDFALALGRGFVAEEDRAGTVAVHSFFHPDHRERVEVVRARTVEAVGWYEDTYGFFPRSSVGIVQGHPQWGGGFPMAGVFIVHLGNLADDFLAFITGDWIVD